MALCEYAPNAPWKAIFNSDDPADVFPDRSHSYFLILYGFHAVLLQVCHTDKPYSQNFQNIRI